ncbi:MAG: SurA N-terminal domain-containing protein [Clostridia bacterium]|nr:SurA N-terminal domain-containing protein [Clostridia bacterium]
MKKGIALIAMLLAAMMMLSGCNLIGYDAELDGAQVVAKVNDTELTKADWLTYREYLANYYNQYYQQYFGMSMPMDEATIAGYGEEALEQMIQSTVMLDKMEELGFEPLPEEDAAEVEEYADSMVDMYKMILRYQNHPDVETVEEESERLAAEATASEATPAEPAVPVATMTNAELDALLSEELLATGYSREYFVESQTASVQNEKLQAYATEGVAVTDEQVKAEFDEQAAQQKETYDANPAAYASAVNYGTEPYYIPEGYRGVKNLLVMLTKEKQDEIDALKAELTTAQALLDDGNAQLEEIKAEDLSAYDEAAVAEINEQIAALETQVTEAQATIDEKQAKIDEVTEAAFAEILPKAQDVLAKAQAGEDFDELIELYGEDTGMTAEPAKTRGYLVCDGLALYEQAFQDAAMALANVGDISAELVQTSYGYHILQYTTDIAAGNVEYTDEIKDTLYETMLTEAKDAAFDAAVTQWVSEAKVETFPKVME